MKEDLPPQQYERVVQRETFNVSVDINVGVGWSDVPRSIILDAMRSPSDLYFKRDCWEQDRWSFLQALSHS
jgi:hypothetical protein